EIFADELTAAWRGTRLTGCGGAGVALSGMLLSRRCRIDSQKPSADPSREVVNVFCSIRRKRGSISFRNWLSRVGLVTPFLKRLLAKVMVQVFLARVIAT